MPENMPVRSGAPRALAVAIATAVATPLVLGGPAGAQDGKGLVPFDSNNPPRQTVFTGDSPATVSKDSDISIRAAAAAKASGSGLAALAPACSSGWACIWQNQNFAGLRGQFQGSNQSWGSFAAAGCPSGNWKNCASSAVNFKPGGTSFAMFVDVNYGGAVAGLLSGNTAPQFFGGFDNNFESNTF